MIFNLSAGNELRLQVMLYRWILMYILQLLGSEI